MNHTQMMNEKKRIILIGFIMHIQNKKIINILRVKNNYPYIVIIF
jgi:hypothetical protein